MTVGPCNTLYDAYAKNDFGKKCSNAGCEDASVVSTDNITSVPTLTDIVTPKKCESINQPTWTGNVCLLNGDAAEKYLPVCVKF